MKKCLFVLIAAIFSFIVSAEETQQKERFYFFYSESCPHCHDAMPLIESLEKEFQNIDFQKLEVSPQSPENQAIFNKKMEKLGTQVSGVPTFVFRDKYVVGFIKGTFEEKIRAMITASAEKPAVLSDKTDKSKQTKTPAQPEKTPKKTAPAPAK